MDYCALVKDSLTKPTCEMILTFVNRDSILPIAIAGKGSFGSRKELAQKLENEKPLTVVALHPSQTVAPPIASTQMMKAGPGLSRERALPPLPPKTPRMLPPLTTPPTSLMSKVEVMPRIDSAPSPSVYSPASPPPPGLPSPATSPSIADLGRRSTVKQRLAELQKAEEVQSLSSPSPKRTNGSLSSFSPASTTGTGRSGFLSILTSEGEVEPNGAKEHVPFEHLRESRLLYSPGAHSMTKEDSKGAGAGMSERPVLERNESTRSELPYANDEPPENDRATHLSEHLGPISDDVSTIKNQIGSEKRGRTLHQVMQGIDDRSRSTKGMVEELVRKFESLQKPSPSPSCKETREALETTRIDLSNKIDALMERLGSIGGPQRGPETELSSLAPFTSPVATKADINALKEHIEGALTTQIVSFHDGVSAPKSTEISRKSVEELSKIINLIESDNGQRALQVQQQTDSVRYLNELNAWLESFVRNGTAQINGLATNVEQLCKDLGSGHEASGRGILNDIYNMLSELRNRSDTSTLKYSVDKLAETINASSQGTMNTQVLANFMERQRQDQGEFLRALTTEIFGEIKGERLRFVEAMKEATVINIQMQVDQLKKELARQVVIVAQDLGRLESEKREVETKIANLHAFHANQRQNSGEPAPLTVTANRQTYRPLSRQPQYPAYAAYHHSRPLPYPR